MVDVATSVEVQGLLQRYKLLDVGGGESFGLLLHQVVEIRHVSPVMPAVVEVDDLATHDGFERSHLPRQVLELDAGEAGRRCGSSAHAFLDQGVQHFLFVSVSCYASIILVFK